MKLFSNFLTGTVLSDTVYLELSIRNISRSQVLEISDCLNQDVDLYLDILRPKYCGCQYCSFVGRGKKNSLPN